MSLGSDNGNNIALLGIKCLYELQDINITRNSVSRIFLAQTDVSLTLRGVHISPVDSAAIFEYINEALKSENCKLTELNLQANGVTDQGAKYLTDAFRSENCKLTKLSLDGNEVTDQGAKYLSDTLKSENCKLTELSLVYNKVTDLGFEYLSEALKSENCKLTELNVRNNKVTDQGAKYLSVL